MSRNFKLLTVVNFFILILVIIFLLYFFLKYNENKSENNKNTVIKKEIIVTKTISPQPSVSPTPQISNIFSPSFSKNLVLSESDKSVNSNNSDWWLNSGGDFIIENGIGRTLRGDIPKLNKWNTLYSKSNPLDTDNGAHPQNLFRLVTKNKWKNLKQELYFRITKDNLSTSPNRNSSNGVLLFNRYKNGDNLYYVGLRVDGKLIIKKKINGIYSTLDQRKIYNGIYDVNSSSNLIPKNKWIGIRSEVKNTESGNVLILIYLDKEGNGSWEQIFTTEDNDREKLNQEGFGGLRTDFMDVEFKKYKIEESN